MALEPGTFVEGPTGRRGQVVSATEDGQVKVEWTPMQAQILPEDTTVEAEDQVRVVPLKELGNDPTAPGPGWAPEEAPREPVNTGPTEHVPGCDPRSPRG